MKVANATLKTGSSWKDNGDGTYTGTYTAAAAGTGLKATVKLSGWGAARQSEAYAITAATPAEAKSAIKTDATTYVSGADMTVKVTLKDASDNAVTGAASSLTADTVKVANATLKTGSSWTDNGDGTYTGTYTAAAAGTGLKATVKLSGWGAARQSEAYAITDVSLQSINGNGFQYSKDVGFPTTGFTGAQFTLNLSGGDASDYNWSSDANWASVTNGVVKFISTGTGSRVTITGIPKNGEGSDITYSFKLNSWFNNSGETMLTWSDAATDCKAQGYALATVLQLNGNSDHSRGSRGTIGGLFSEWGDGLGGISSNYYWSSEHESEEYAYAVSGDAQNIIAPMDIAKFQYVCRMSL